MRAAPRFETSSIFRNLVGRERVKATTERVQLNEVEVLALRCHLSRSVQARVVHPLVDHADGTLERAQMRDGVFGEHRQSEAGQQLGDGVVDLGIVMVRTPGQHDSVRAGFFHPPQRLFALGPHVALELLVLGPGLIDGSVDFSTGRQLRVPLDDASIRFSQLEEQAFLQVVLLVVGQPRVQERRSVGFTQLVDVEAQRLGVACDDRAVVVVASTFAFLALPFGAGHPDEVRVLLEQVHHVAVRKLRGIAHRLGRHGLDARLVGFLS